jgi:hypothetical protein
MSVSPFTGFCAWLKNLWVGEHFFEYAFDLSLYSLVVLILRRELDLYPLVMIRKSDDRSFQKKELPDWT